MAAMENDFENTTISLYGTVPDSIVDGPGLRYAVFVQGCSHHCPGCHNPEKHFSKISPGEFSKTSAMQRGCHFGGTPYTL